MSFFLWRADGVSCLKETSYLFLSISGYSIRRRFHIKEEENNNNNNNNKSKNKNKTKQTNKQTNIRRSKLAWKQYQQILPTNIYVYISSSNADSMDSLILSCYLSLSSTALSRSSR